MIEQLKSFGAACAMAAAGFALTAAPASAQSSADLKALDAQLPGTLVNDPSRIDWQSYGADLNASAVVDESIPGGGAARRFEIKRAAEFIYVAGTNVPLTKKVNRGEQITIGFYARTIESDEPDGKGVVRVRFQENAEPYPGFGEQTLSIGKDWQWYEVTAQAERTLDTRDGIVALQFGRSRQILEIGQAIIVSGSDNIAGASPVTVAAARVQMPDLEMPDGLADTGMLINNPAQAMWKFDGTAGTYTNRDEPGIWMMRATQFDVVQDGTALTDLKASVPITQRIEEGDELTIAIAARTITSAKEDGRAVAASRIQGTVEPFESFASNRFTIGDKWQLIKIQTKAPRAYGAGEAVLELYFGGNQQKVDLGPVYVFRTNSSATN